MSSVSTSQHTLDQKILALRLSNSKVQPLEQFCQKKLKFQCFLSRHLFATCCCPNCTCISGGENVLQHPDNNGMKHVSVKLISLLPTITKQKQNHFTSSTDNKTYLSVTMEYVVKFTKFLQLSTDIKLCQTIKKIVQYDVTLQKLNEQYCSQKSTSSAQCNKLAMSDNVT